MALSQLITFIWHYEKLVSYWSGKWMLKRSWGSGPKTALSSVSVANMTETVLLRKSFYNSKILISDKLEVKLNFRTPHYEIFATKAIMIISRCLRILLLTHNVKYQ